MVKISEALAVRKLKYKPSKFNLLKRKLMIATCSERHILYIDFINKPSPIPFLTKDPHVFTITLAPLVYLTPADNPPPVHFEWLVFSILVF